MTKPVKTSTASTPVKTPVRARVKQADGSIVEITDQEFQYGRWWSKKVDQFNRELHCFRFPVPLEKGGESKPFHFKRIVSALWPENGPKPFVWHPWAEAMLEAACENKYLAVAGCASSGKCLAPHVPVLMFDGSIKRNDEVQIGDQLMGPDSKPRNVLRTNSGQSNMVRIVPVQGEPWECNDDHVLTLKRTQRVIESKQQTGEFIDISVKKYLTQGNNFKAQYKLVSTGVEFLAQPIDSEPREYGIWLGGYPWLGKGPEIKKYLYNTRNVRMQVLSGIIDSSGKARNICYEVKSFLPEVTEATIFLARSLGFKVTHRVLKLRGSGKEGDVTCINIYGDVESIPTIYEKCLKATTRKNMDCTSFHVEQLGKGDWYGYTLDGDGRFLLGDFTITHNTDLFAVWAIVNFIVAPYDTMVLVTSTTLKDSRKRIWGSVRDYWQASPPLPGRLVDSMGLIRFEDGAGGASDKSGITLIAAEKKKEKEAVGKLIGFKNKRVIVIADEMPELSESILEASASNLSLNPEFQFIGIGNPASRFDAFGVLAKPKDGWQSISPLDSEWETVRGKCIRFDGELSPNVVANKLLYPWLVTREKLEEAKASFGENSLAYYRMFRGYWAPTGDDDNIYSETEIVAAHADEPAIWLEEPVRVAALDPAFTNGGDRSILYFGLYGQSREGIPTLCYTNYVLLRDDVANKRKTRSEQIVEQMQLECESRGVLPENVAYDASGAGGPFGDVVNIAWSRDPLRIQFGGKASEMPVSATDGTAAFDRYVNRVTELWFSAKELIRNGQLKGIEKELAKEMCARKYITEKGISLRMRVESKIDMKSRTGQSPDIADAAAILIELCRQKFGFGGTTKLSQRTKSSCEQKRTATFSKLSTANSERRLMKTSFDAWD